MKVKDVIVIVEDQPNQTRMIIQKEELLILLNLVDPNSEYPQEIVEMGIFQTLVWRFFCFISGYYKRKIT